MKSKNLTESQSLEFAEKVAKTRLNDNPNILTVDFKELLTVNRVEDTGNDVFTVYNRIQENLFRNGLKYTILTEEGKQRQSRTRKVKENSLAYVEMNQLVWNAAAELVG